MAKPAAHFQRGRLPRRTVRPFACETPTMTPPPSDADPSLAAPAADSAGSNPPDDGAAAVGAPPKELDEATRLVVQRKLGAGDTPWSVQRYLISLGFTEAAAVDAVAAQPKVDEVSHRAAADLVRQRAETERDKKAQASLFGLQPWIESPLTFFGGAALVGLVVALTLVVNLTSSLGELYLVRGGLFLGGAGLLARSFYEAMD